MKGKSTGARISLVLAMTIFGTIGIARKFIPLPSGMVAFARGAIGMLFLLGILLIRRERVERCLLVRHLPMLILSGGLIGFNWILLFEAYRYTTVATATLCYYMAPLFVMLLSPIILHERLTGKRIGCMVLAFIGMILVSGVIETGFGGISELSGVLFGLSAALLYASVVILNQFLKEIPAFQKTAIQLGSAALVVLPYTLIVEPRITEPLAWYVLPLLILVGILHTGIAYALYFGSMKALPAQTVALFSYLDPIVAILLSLIVLREPMTLLSAIGAVLILGSTVLSERV
ncbi:MAG: DMT family transporter [Ruminococcaceae bacterium]|nr:DMT family transporter [Oscillospiraceae bacterium]